jgi:hypothetical protein
VLSTIAVIFGQGLVVLIVALRAFPVENEVCFLIELLVDVLDPLLDAFQMHRDAATVAGPNPVFSSYFLSANHTNYLVMATLFFVEVGSLEPSFVIASV